MFSSLFEQYKLDVININTSTSLKEMKRYEKIGLFMILLGGLLSICFDLVSSMVGIFTGFLITAIGIILIVFIRNTKAERSRIIEEKLKPNADSRIERLKNLLISYGVNIEDDAELDEIIKRAKCEYSSYPLFGEIIKPLSGLHNTLFIPIVTLFLAEYFKGIDAFQILKRAAILLLICAILMLVLSFFSYNIKDIFDADKRALLYFIKDIEDVKIFRHKNQEMQETSSVSVDKRID